MGETEKVKKELKDLYKIAGDLKRKLINLNLIPTEFSEILNKVNNLKIFLKNY